jgi:rhodanese-related sulfurtransferase
VRIKLKDKIGGMEMISKNYFFAFFLIAIISTSFAQEKNIRDMSVDELKIAIKNDSSLVILDVRNPEELDGPLGKINGVVNIPIQELESRINELLQYKNKPIAVICRSGKRSEKVPKFLLRMVLMLKMFWAA